LFLGEGFAAETRDLAASPNIQLHHVETTLEAGDNGLVRKMYLVHLRAVGAAILFVDHHKNATSLPGVREVFLEIEERVFDERLGVERAGRALI
jgi:hypothetical protein